MCVNILFHLHSYNCKNQILINNILSVPKFASMLIQYSLPQNKKHSMLLLDNHIDTSQCLIKWYVKQRPTTQTTANSIRNTCTIYINLKE